MTLALSTWTFKSIPRRAVILAQLVAQVLQIPEVLDSNPTSDFIKNFCTNCDFEKMQIKGKERQGMVHLKKVCTAHHRTKTFCSLLWVGLVSRSALCDVRLMSLEPGGVMATADFRGNADQSVVESRFPWKFVNWTRAPMRIQCLRYR